MRKGVGDLLGSGEGGRGYAAARSPGDGVSEREGGGSRGRR